ncbi:MAG TPA: hypothetical protein VEI97_10870, partial [bacterium]|nr:hypothetical protein [bacterium]
DNDALYVLPIDNFLSTGGVTVKNVRLTGATLDIDYRFTHPFPSSTTANRADLGVAGFLLFLADVPGATGNSYFTGTTDVVANTALVANADAYWSPRGLVDATGMTANTFPYKLFVDEAADNRINPATEAAISNGGIPTGNYVAPNGWQTGGSDTWTGYGVLHQGQAADNTLSLSLTELEGTEFSLDFAAIAKYNDPRSGTPGKLHRLPGNPPNLLTHFGYRMPHGSLDVEKIVYDGEGGGYIAGSASVSELRFHVRDWDARATITTLPELKDDPDGTHIWAGALGPPTLEVSIPGVLGDASAVGSLGSSPTDDDSTQGGDPGVDSGHAGDELYYAAGVPQPTDPTQAPGTYTGLARATDPEITTPIYLDADLTPVTTNLPAPITYQAFTVEVAPPPSTTWALRYGGSTADFAVASCVDTDGNLLITGTFTGAVDFGGGVRTAVGSYDVFVLKLGPDGAYIWDKTFGGIGLDNVVDIARASANQIWITGSFSDPIDFGNGPLTSAGSEDIFLAKLDPANGTSLFSARYGGTQNDVPQSVAVGFLDYPCITGSFGGTVDFGGGPRVSAGGSDIFVAAFLSSGVHRFSNRYGSGSVNEAGRGVASYPDGSFGVTGWFGGTADFGGGNRSASGFSDAFVVRLGGSIGTYMFDKQWGSVGADSGIAIATDNISHAYVTGNFQNSVDFGGGPLSVTGGTTDNFAVRIDSMGNHAWSRAFGGTDIIDLVWSVAVDNAGGTYISGSFQNTFNGGGGTLTSAGLEDGYLLKFDATGGAHIWSHRFGGAGLDRTSSVTPLVAGSIAHIGSFTGTVDFDPGAGVTNLVSAGASDGYASRLNADGTF